VKLRGEDYCRHCRGSLIFWQFGHSQMNFGLSGR
jgi:hypothetical protein